MIAPAPEGLIPRVVAGLGFPDLERDSTQPVGWQEPVRRTITPDGQPLDQPGGALGSEDADTPQEANHPNDSIHDVAGDVSRETPLRDEASAEWSGEANAGSMVPGGSPLTEASSTPVGSDDETNNSLGSAAARPAEDAAPAIVEPEARPHGGDVSRETPPLPTPLVREATQEGGDIATDEIPSDPAGAATKVADEGVSRETPESPLASALADTVRRRQKLAEAQVAKPPHPRVMTVANQKGGVGKTTTTVNVAAALAQRGLNVLVIDLDPQGNASTALGIDHHAEIDSIYDVLVDGMPLADVVVPCPDLDHLWCAPATIDLAGAEIELVSLVARETRLRKAIEAYIAGAEEKPDYIFIDCPPSLGLLTINAFVGADEVFIPIQCEYYALEGLSALLKNIELIRTHLNQDLRISTILLTMYDARTRLAAQVAEEVRAHFPEQTLKTTVPRSVRVSEAPSHGQTVITYDPQSTGALSYFEAATEVAQRANTSTHNAKDNT